MARPGFKRIVLNGGPNDGQELTIRGTRNMVVTGVTDDGAVDPRSVEKGAVYVLDTEDDGVEQFQFLGHRTTEEIREMLNGGYVGGGDCDEGEEWKK